MNPRVSTATQPIAEPAESRLSGPFGRAIVLAYGVVAYALFLVTFLYAIGFVAGVGVPKGIDDGETTTFAAALAINVALMGLFGVQHSVMARPWFKRILVRIVPRPMERATFVYATCAVFALLFWQWRPMPEIVWSIQQPALRAAVHGLFGLGFGIVLYASFLIDHFDLFGMRQVVLHFRSRAYTHHPFVVRSLYRLVRHPLMVGFLIAFWAAPTMTVGRLLFALVTTLYILVAIRFEERDLVSHLGESYRGYQRSTPALVPGVRPIAAGRTAAAG